MLPNGSPVRRTGTRHRRRGPRMHRATESDMKGITLPAVLALLSGCTSTTAILDEDGTVTVKSERSALLGDVASLINDAHKDHRAICGTAGLSDATGIASASGTSVPTGLERASKTLNTIKGVVGAFPAHSVTFARKCSCEGLPACKMGHAVPSAASGPRLRQRTVNVRAGSLPTGLRRRRMRDVRHEGHA